MTEKGSMCIQRVSRVTTNGIRWPGIALDCCELCCLERFTRVVDKLETRSNNITFAFIQIFANTWERGTACGCGAAVTLVRVSSMEMSYLEVLELIRTVIITCVDTIDVDVQEEGLALLYYALAATHRTV